MQTNNLKLLIQKRIPKIIFKLRKKNNNAILNSKKNISFEKDKKYIKINASKLHAKIKRQCLRDKNKDFAFKYMERVKNQTSCNSHNCQWNFKNNSFLEFDHLRDKKHNISKLLCRAYNTKNIFKLTLELDKCQLLCIPCHRIKTFKNYNNDQNLSPNLKIIKQFINDIKINIFGCSKHYPFLYDFDHIERHNKRFSVNYYDTYKYLLKNHYNHTHDWFNIIIDEILKCQILFCTNHKLKSLKKNDYVPLIYTKK
jgi:hypothetical protein